MAAARLYAPETRSGRKTAPMADSVNGMAPRLGVDIGGTFTDVALETGQGLVHDQGPDHPPGAAAGRHAGDRHRAEGRRAAAFRAGHLVIHGTTLATNALIERKGAKTAFLTTDGFRDTLQIMTEGRFDVYDVNIDLPEPLVPRELRLDGARAHERQGRAAEGPGRGRGQQADRRRTGQAQDRERGDRLHARLRQPLARAPRPRPDPGADCPR